MCRIYNSWLEDKEEKQEIDYDKAIELLMAIVFILKAEANPNFLFDEETNEVEFL